MTTIDLTGISTAIPVFGFLLVFSVTSALLSKTKLLGEHKFLNIMIGFLIAILFLVSANAVKYVELITPWVAGFLVSLLFISLVVGMIHKDIDTFFPPWFAWIIVILLIVIFFITSTYVFGDLIGRYLQGPKEFLLQPSIFTIIILFIVTLFAGWVITKEIAVKK